MLLKTVRYVKLMYIISGILTSKAEVCATVDQIKIGPQIECRDILRPKKLLHLLKELFRNLFECGKVILSIESFTFYKLPFYMLRIPTKLLRNT